MIEPSAANGGGRVADPESDGRITTVRLASSIGFDHVRVPDPTEDYHEASRIHPGVVDPTVVGAAQLERSLALRMSATRSVKRFTEQPFVQLPSPKPVSGNLVEALAQRRSRRSYDAESMSIRELSTLLHAAYGVTGGVASTSQTFRTAPSAGALYPLELYAVCPRIRGLEAALFHYDPLRHGLERLRLLDSHETTADLTPYPELLVGAPLLVIVTAMFWRSRFKYGARAYRFVLLEAGHVAHSLLLAAEALGLAATPVGGFFDRRVDEFVGVDGLHEASIYLLPVGRRAK